jgi:Tfp pilus assembly protein PilP
MASPGSCDRGSGRARLRVLSLVVLCAACGDDSGGGQPGQPGGPPPPPPPPQPGQGSGMLQPKHMIEDNVSESERATIRHPFRDKDFAEGNRDPFESSSMLAAGSAGSNMVVAKVVECHSRIVAPNYSYADLKLVGIVHQGIQNKVLMMDPGNVGRIIATGECVGKEKAVVTEITYNYVTFLVTPEFGPAQGGARQAEKHSVKLHETDLDTINQSQDLSQPNPEPEVAPVLPSNGGQGQQSVTPAPSR